MDDPKYRLSVHAIHRHTCCIIETVKRTTIFLPDEVLANLKKLSHKTGAPMAELIRRAIEAYLKKMK